MIYHQTALRPVYTTTNRTETKRNPSNFQLMAHIITSASERCRAEQDLRWFYAQRNYKLYTKIFFLIKPTDVLISQIYFCRETTCFGQFHCPSSDVFHCPFGTGICHQTCMTYTCAQCTVENSIWWAEELPETCSFSTKINLGN